MAPGASSERQNLKKEVLVKIYNIFSAIRGAHSLVSLKVLQKKKRFVRHTFCEVIYLFRGGELLK